MNCKTKRIIQWLIGLVFISAVVGVGGYHVFEGMHETHPTHAQWVKFYWWWFTSTTLLSLAAIWPVDMLLQKQLWSNWRAGNTVWRFLSWVPVVVEIAVVVVFLVAQSNTSATHPSLLVSTVLVVHSINVSFFFLTPRLIHSERKDLGENPASRQEANR